MSLDEDQVKNALIPVLFKSGFIPKLKTIKESGADIIARHTKYSRSFIIEVKGDPPKGVKSPNSGREVRFLQSIGQLITRINPDSGYYYGLAYPSSYKDLVTRRLNRSLLKKLKIHLFFVDDKHKVEQMKPSKK